MSIWVKTIPQSFLRLKLSYFQSSFVLLDNFDIRFSPVERGRSRSPRVPGSFIWQNNIQWLKLFLHLFELLFQLFVWVRRHRSLLVWPWAYAWPVQFIIWWIFDNRFPSYRSGLLLDHIILLEELFRVLLLVNLAVLISCLYSLCYINVSSQILLISLTLSHLWHLWCPWNQPHWGYIVQRGLSNWNLYYVVWILQVLGLNSVTLPIIINFTTSVLLKYLISFTFLILQSLLSLWVLNLHNITVILNMGLVWDLFLTLLKMA